MPRPPAVPPGPANATAILHETELSSPALRLIGLLEHVARADKALTLTDIIGHIHQPKPTVYRMLQQLEQAGLLVKEPDGKRYAPGPRLSRLSEDVLLNAQVRAARHAILQELVEELGETCNYTMPAGTEVVYLDRVETAWPLRFHLQPGSRVPMHCSASGKLFLAHMPPVQRDRLLSHLQYRGYTPNTITSRIGLEAELARVRAQGYALDNEEFLTGLVCVAVAVFEPGRRSKVRGSVAVQAPASRLPIERATSALPALRRAAEAFGAAIGPADEPAPRPAHPLAPAKAKARSAVRGAVAGATGAAKNENARSKAAGTGTTVREKTGRAAGGRPA